MKKVILITLSILSFIILIGEPVQLNIADVIIKTIALGYLVIFAKANNYFNKGE